MKKSFFKKILVILPFLALSCIEDDVAKLTDQGSTFISIYGGAENKLFYDAFTDVRKVDLFNIRRNSHSEADLKSSTTVKLTAAPDLIEAYNEKNGTSYEWLPSSIYTLANNPGVTVNGNEVDMNFGAGDFAKDLTINLDGSKWDLSKKYAVAYKITDPGNGKVSGDDYLITFISAKNKWDGIYDVVNSTMVDVVNPALVSPFSIGESYQYALETISPTKCVVVDYTFGTNAPNFIIDTGGSGLSRYGSFGLIVEFDPKTDKIIAVTNYYGQPAGNTRAALLDDTGINQYKNGQIDIKWHMTQSSAVPTPPHIRSTWEETWKYAKSR